MTAPRIEPQPVYLVEGPPGPLRTVNLDGRRSQRLYWLGARQVQSYTTHARECSGWARCPAATNRPVCIIYNPAESLTNALLRDLQMWTNDAGEYSLVYCVRALYTAATATPDTHYTDLRLLGAYSGSELVRRPSLRTAYHDPLTFTYTNLPTWWAAPITAGTGVQPQYPIRIPVELFLPQGTGVALVGTGATSSPVILEARWWEYAAEKFDMNP